jgi:hypothetical protein
VIYTALAWRNKSFGSALEFVWGDDSNVYATRESSNTSGWLLLISGRSRYSYPCCCRRQQTGSLLSSWVLPVQLTSCS